MKMQTNLDDKNANNARKEIQSMKGNNNAILIYENKYGSKLICKCKDETS